jgi:OmpA-OmpF porin, OOP family
MQSFSPLFRRPRWRVLALAALVPAVCVAAGDAREYLPSEFGGGPVVRGRAGCIHGIEWDPGMRFADCEPALRVPALIEPPQAVPAVRTARPQPQVAPFRLATGTLFDFDSATLRPQGRAALDMLAQKITDATYDRVQITGHADPIGTASYNRRLSERRAQAVAAHLAARGVNAAKLATSGMGSAAPAVFLANCKGKRGAAARQCLQRDRYAEIVVTGTSQQAFIETGEIQ